jgi:predicted kinase
VTAVPPLLLIVTGPPAAGKTTLAVRLAADLRLPLFTKDLFKEALHDRLHGIDGIDSQLGLVAYDLLFVVMEAELAAGRSLVLEANFRPAVSTQHFQSVLSRHPALPVQIHCTAAPDLLASRFRARFDSGERHPVHADRELGLDRAIHFHAEHGPLDLGGPVIRVETDDFAAVDYPGILDRVRRSCGRDRSRRVDSL